MQFIELPCATFPKHSASIARMWSYYFGWKHNGVQKIVRGSSSIIINLLESIIPFGNTLILFAGYFSQTLDVIFHFTSANEVNAWLKYFILWCHVAVKINDNYAYYPQQNQIFSHQLVENNGKAPTSLTSGWISLPHNFCNLMTSKKNLLKKYFPIFQV